MHCTFLSVKLSNLYLANTTRSHSVNALIAQKEILREQKNVNAI